MVPGEAALTRSASPGPTSASEELAAVAEVLESGQLTMGPKVAELEEQLAARLRRRARRRGLVRDGRAAPRRARARDRPGRRGARPRVHVPGDRERRRARRRHAGARRRRPRDDEPRPRRGYDAVTPRTKADLAVHLFGRPRDSRSCRALPLAARTRPARSARARQGRALRRPRRARLPLVPPAQDRHDRRGRGRDDERRAARRRASAGCATTAEPADGYADMPAPGLNYRLSDVLCAIGIPQLAAARRAARRARARRDGVRRAARGLRRDRRAPTRATATAGRPTSSSSTAATRRSRRCARRGSRPDRDVRAPPAVAPTATRATFPGADACFERALALPFHTRLTEAELDRVAEALDRL